MATLTTPAPKQSISQLAGMPLGSQMTYAIAFDLDTNILKDLYHAESYNNAYTDIRKHLQQHGFEWQQGSVYFGGESVDAVACVLAVQSLAKQFQWFAASVRDIRMLRIEENNDLGPAIEAGGS